MSHFEVWCLLEAGAYCDLRVNSAALILGKALIRGNTVYILEWYMILLKKLSKIIASYFNYLKYLFAAKKLSEN